MCWYLGITGSNQHNLRSNKTELNFHPNSLIALKKVTFIVRSTSIHSSSTTSIVVESLLFWRQRRLSRRSRPSFFWFQPTPSGDRPGSTWEKHLSKLKLFSTKIRKKEEEDGNSFVYRENNKTRPSFSDWTQKFQLWFYCPWIKYRMKYFWNMQQFLFLSGWGGNWGELWKALTVG